MALLLALLAYAVGLVDHPRWGVCAAIDGVIVGIPLALWGFVWWLERPAPPPREPWPRWKKVTVFVAVAFVLIVFGIPSISTRW
jgi:hypothetical protein